MTAIIAIKDGKRIMVGTDGRSCTDDDAWAIRNKESYKVKRIDGSPNCLIACAGYVHRNSVISNIPNLLDGKDDVTFKYLVNKTLPKIYDELEKLRLIKQGEKYNEIDSSVIIATKKHLFKISGYGIVTECAKVAIAGSGDDMLLCKYQNIKDLAIPTQDKITMCLKHAIKYGQSIGYPIVIESTIKEDPTIIIKY